MRDGHLHHVHGDHVDRHVLEVNATNPDQCTADHPAVDIIKPMYTDRVVDMRRFRMETMSIIWQTATCIIPAAVTVMIMEQCA